ncbi:LysR family transcriptional regulator [Roseovarius autotrophicus]|uniref:LysR family transcriptional regulator n=1 Tax=Roseovarius autotrophicus TaxID=2824121 RepID=UPI0019E294AE|nr:LysR family transcriptional regulator [Roseovarius autotrophicus]MBE0454228.1 LysR family transcriptional regulator [Roseovarius sp.]
MSTSRPKVSYARLFDDLRVTLAVHRCGSMTRAAVELDTTTSTVSRQISRLRGTLGLSPFIKSEGDWLLNPRMAALLNAVEHANGMIESELGRLIEAAPEEPREIRIGALPSVISHILIPALGELRTGARNLRPIFENRVHEVGLGMSDVALVFSLPEGGRIKARRCGDLAFALYAPPCWTRGHGWVSLTDRYAARYAEARRAWFGCNPTLKVDSFAQAVAAMRALGLAGILPVVVGGPEPDFVHIPGSGLDLTRDLHLIYHESRSEDADLRCVIDWICQQISRTPSESPLSLRKSKNQTCASSG